MTKLKQMSFCVLTYTTIYLGTTIIVSLLSESEQLMMAQSRELDASLEKAKGELEAVQDQRETVEEQLKAVQADFASFKTVVDRTLQDVQKENESLKVQCSKKDKELEVCDLSVSAPRVLVL